jgi:hypothetical protein
LFKKVKWNEMKKESHLKLKKSEMKIFFSSSVFKTWESKFLRKEKREKKERIKKEKRRRE